MTIYKRGSVWWSNFTVNGKRVQCSTGCTDKAAAAKWEKDKVAAVAGEGDAKIALEKVRRALVKENISPAAAWDAFECFPRATRPGDKLMGQYKAVVDDFFAFAAGRVKVLADVEDRHAREYVCQLRDRGRFSGFSYDRGGKSVKVAKTVDAMAPRTVNFYIGTLKLFFGVMHKLKYVVESPFESVEKISGKAVSREIFSDAEIAMLLEQRGDALYPIVALGLYAGLRRGDIVRINAADCDFARGFIRLDQHKTGGAVSIPMLPPVRALVLEAIRRHPAGPLFPELLDIYDDQDEKLSKAFKLLLDRIGITSTTIAVPGRSRRQSVKDIHSLRHTFAYVAGRYGVPLNIVQSILGHMTPAMTRHYMAHANDADKTAAMAAFPDLSKRSATKPGLALRVGRLLERITPDNLESAKRRIGKLLGGVQ